MKFRIKVFSFVLLVCVSALSTSPVYAQSFRRLQYLGSSNITLPTGYLTKTTTYTDDDGHKTVLYSQPFGKYFEISDLHHLNDEGAGKNVFNLKMTVLEEDKLLPNVVWGVGDVGMTLGSRIFFFAGSKTFDAFAATIHGGIIKDPATTEKKSFAGFEKTVFPLIVLAAERFDGMTTYGLKMRPYPGISLECARRDDGGDGEDKTIYQIQYLKSF